VLLRAFRYERREASGQPKAQLIQYFVDLAERATQQDYRGCPFVNVAAEFPDASHPARERVAQNKALLMKRLVELCEGAGARAAGARRCARARDRRIYAASQTYRHGETPIGTAPALATQLIEAACA
jgi:transposase